MLLPLVETLGSCSGNSMTRTLSFNFALLIMLFSFPISGFIETLCLERPSKPGYTLTFWHFGIAGGELIQHLQDVIFSKANASLAEANAFETAFTKPVICSPFGNVQSFG
jgi:hypothetical protein